MHTPSSTSAQPFGAQTSERRHASGSGKASTWRDRIGAFGLVGRASKEIAATGARPRKVLRTGLDALTASERRVAQLAADGMSNKEIAQLLFVTIKTVEMHLSHAYRKLGISPAQQLDKALPSPAPSPAPAFVLLLALTFGPRKNLRDELGVTSDANRLGREAESCHAYQWLDELRAQCPRRQRARRLLPPLGFDGMSELPDVQALVSGTSDRLRPATHGIRANAPPAVGASTVPRGAAGSS